MNVDGVTLRSPVTVIQVVKATAAALPPDTAVTKGQSAVLANREARGVNGTGLWWVIELELIVGGNVTCSTVCVFENAIVESEGEGVICLAEGDRRGIG